MQNCIRVSLKTHNAKNHIKKGANLKFAPFPFIDVNILCALNGRIILMAAD